MHLEALHVCDRADERRYYRDGIAADEMTDHRLSRVDVVCIAGRLA